MPRDTKDGPDKARLQRVLREIADEALADDDVWGTVSNQMPDTNVEQFGIAAALRGGGVVTAGMAETPFVIQSISKVFSLTLALQAFDEAVWRRVGREPSGDPFNSIVDMERHNGVPRNPLINAGALVVIDMLLDRAEQAEHPHFVRAFLADRLGVAAGTIALNAAVVGAEHESGFGNRAIANLAKSFDNLHHPVEDVMEVYVRQCAVELSCAQLAAAGRYLMMGRVDPEARIDRAAASRVRRINAIMLTCGQYDGSGDFAYRVGLPAKSGVGGGILAIVPDIAAVAVWAPGLDENGNSLLGTRALERLSERMDWSIFGAVEPA